MSNLLRILVNIFYIENILLLRPLGVNVATIRLTSCSQYALLLPPVNFVFLFWFTFKLIIFQNGREWTVNPSIYYKKSQNFSYHFLQSNILLFSYFLA